MSDAVPASQSDRRGRRAGLLIPLFRALIRSWGIGDRRSSDDRRWLAGPRRRVLQFPINE